MIRSAGWPGVPTTPSTTPPLSSPPAGSFTLPRPWTSPGETPPSTAAWAACHRCAPHSTTQSGWTVGKFGRVTVYVNACKSRYLKMNAHFKQRETKWTRKPPLFFLSFPPSQLFEHKSCNWWGFSVFFFCWRKLKGTADAYITWEFES